MKNRCILMLLVIVIACSNVQVNASSIGIYTVKATPSYKHPVTNEVEDSGNNEGIGQSMTESVIYNTALMEIDTNGKIYVTARYFLTDQISDIKIWTQKRGASGWTSASTTIMQENVGGKLCSDYRFILPAKDAIVKTSCYVEAMGRSVIFYYSFSNLKSGSADFVTTIEVDVSEANTSKTTNSTEETKESTTKEDNTSTEKVIESSSNTTEDISAKKEEATTTDAEKEEESLSTQEKISKADGLITSLDTEDSESEKVTEGVVTVEEEKSSFVEVFQIVVAAILAGVLTGGILIVLIGVGAYYIIKTIKEREN